MMFSFLCCGATALILAEGANNPSVEYAARTYTTSGEMCFSTIWMWFATAAAMIFLFCALRQANRAKHLAKQLKDVFDFLHAFPGEFAVLDEQETILSISEKTPEPAKKRYLKEIPGINYPRISKELSEVFRTGTKHSFSHIYGEESRAMIISPLPEKLFGKRTAVWISHDSDELREARTVLSRMRGELKRTTTLWNALIQSLPIHIFAKNANDNFRFVFGNKAILNFYGLSQEQFIGATDYDILPKETAKAIRERDEVNRSRPDKPEEIRLDQTGPDGKIHHFRIYQSLVEDGSGSEMLLGAAIDITETETAKKKTDELNSRLQEVLLQHNLLLDNMPAYVYTMDIDNDYRYTACNAECLKLWDKSLDETIGKNDQELFGTEHGEILHRSDVTAAQNNYITEKIIPYWTKNGEERFGRFFRKRLDLPDGRHLLFGFGMDITDLEKAKRELEENKRLFESVLADLPVGVAVKDASRDFRIRICNPAFAAMMKRSEPEIIGRTDEELKSDLFKPSESRAQDREVVCSGFPIDILENTGGEDERTFRVIKKKLTSPDGKDDLLIATFSDVTEIRRSSLQLKAEHELWSSAVDLFPLLFFIKNADKDFVYEQVNHSFLDFFGWKHAEVIGNVDRELFKNRNMDESIVEKNQEALCTPEGIQYERTLTDSQGRFRMLRILQRPFTGPDGTRLLLGVAEDITELRNIIANEEIINRALARTIPETSFEKNLDIIFEAFSEGTECAFTGFFSIRPETREFVEKRHWTGNPGRAEMKFCPFDPGSALDEDLENGKIVILYADGSETGTRLGKQGFGTLFMIPVFLNGEVQGAFLTAFQKKDRMITPTDEHLFRSLANIATLAKIRALSGEMLLQKDRERQLIIDNIDIPIWFYDARGNMLLVNRSARKLTDFPNEEILNRPCREMFECPLNDEECTVGKALSDGKTHRANCRMKDRDFIFEASPIFDETGKIVNAVNSAIDVTELNASIENEKVINYCLETLVKEPDISKSVSAALKAVCEHMNAARTYIFQYDREKRSVTCNQEYFRPDLNPIFDELKIAPRVVVTDWAEIFREGGILHFDRFDSRESRDLFGEYWMELIRKNEVQTIYFVKIMLAGNFWGCLGIIYEKKPHDLTVREIDFLNAMVKFIDLMIRRGKIHAQLMSALEQARAAEKAKGYFIASISHEIRTPLNAIIGFAELLQSDDLPKREEKEYLRSIAFAGTSLLQIVNDVLDLSKLEAERMEIIPEKTNFQWIASETLKVFKHRAEEKKLRIQLKSDQIPMLLLDRLRIRQILFNLIGNAIKFTEKGSIELEAAFTPGTGNKGKLVFEVRDTGIGISEKGLEQLAKPFIQVSGIRSEDAVITGTGMGLAISKKLIQKMGGKFEIESRFGIGSTFRVVLPEVEICSGSTEAPPVEKTEQASFQQLPVRTGFSILIVDDVKMNLKVMSAMCRKMGFGDIAEASSGADALSILEKRSFDLVLTDLWMPGMSGAKLLAHIRKMPGMEKVPVVAVTADSESRGNFSMKEFSDVLLKPVTIDKFREMIQRNQSGAQARN